MQIKAFDCLVLERQNFSNIVTKNKPAGFNVTLDNTGQGPSDHTSFT